MSAGKPRRPPVSGRLHVLNLACSGVVGVAVLGVTRSATWGVVSFLVTGIVVHTLMLNRGLGRR